MDFSTFVSQIKQVAPVGAVFDNPGGGTSQIHRNVGRNIQYLRGSTIIPVDYNHLYDAYQHFRGRVMSSPDLKDFRPAVFDSTARPAGHSCNCTFLMTLLFNLNLSTTIYGEGKRGKPFYVSVF